MLRTKLSAGWNQEDDITNNPFKEKKFMLIQCTQAKWAVIYSSKLPTVKYLQLIPSTF
jgi:hypothetical protein